MPAANATAFASAFSTPDQFSNNLRSSQKDAP